MEFYTYKGYTIGIEPDDSGWIDNPREMGDTLGTMVCKHNRHTLGDDKRIPWDEFSSWEEVESYLRKEEKAEVIMPLYIYEHSCLTMRTYPHGQYANWDGSKVGYIYVTKETIRDWYRVARVTKKLTENVTKILTDEVKEYSSWLNGEAYKYVIWAPGVEVNEEDPDLDTIINGEDGIVWGILGDADDALKDAKLCIDEITPRKED